jgi:hypothetical protein
VTPTGQAGTAGPGGRPLPAPLRRKMESAFGADFSDVRVHQGPAAGSLSALAFTQGRDLHFAPGQYNPATPQGQQIIAHELTHVVQQRQGRVAVPSTGDVPLNADPKLEAEADALGGRAARGEAVTKAVAHGGPVAREAGSGVAPIQGKTNSPGGGRSGGGGKKRDDEESQRVFHMDENGVGHRQPSPISKARQAPPVIYMDQHGVGHREPESSEVNLPPVMVGMPYHREFDNSGVEQPMKSGVLVRHPTDSNKFAEPDDSLREMMFGSMTTDTNGAVSQEPMKPGAIFGMDTQGNLLPETVTEGNATFTSSPPQAMTTNGGFKESSRGAGIELSTGGHSLITTSQVNSGQVVDPNSPSTVQSNINSPRLAVNWGRHDPMIDDNTLRERLTSGAMRYDDPNSASTPVSSKFSSYRAYNESFDRGSDELMQQVNSGGLGIGPTQNSVKIESNQGTTSGEYVQKSGNKPKAKAPSLFSGITSNNKKNQYTVSGGPNSTTDSSMINFNINSLGEPTPAQHYPINKNIPVGTPNVTTSNFGPSGPGPALGTTIKSPKDVVKDRLTQQLISDTGGPLTKNPYDEMFQ